MKKFLCFALALCLALAPIGVFAEEYDNGENGYEYEEYENGENGEEAEEYENGEEAEYENGEEAVVCEYVCECCEYVCECEDEDECEYVCECCEYVCECANEYENGEEYEAEEEEAYEEEYADEYEEIVPIADFPVEETPAERPIDSVPVRYVDGVQFVPFRAAANAYGFYELAWDRATSTVTVAGLVSFTLEEAEGFNDNGTVYVPLAFALSVFE